MHGRFGQRVAASSMIVVALLSALLISAPSFADAVHRDETFGVTITLPGEWTALTPEEVANINAGAANLDSRAGSMSSGFWSDAVQSRGDVYILFQTLQRGPLPTSYQEIARAFGAVDMSPVEDGVRSMGTDIDFGRFVLVREANRLEMRAEITCADGTILVVKSFMFLCRNGLSAMHCYAKSDLFPDWGNTFADIADSAEIPSSQSYAPKSAKAEASPSVFLFVVVPAVVISLVALVIMRTVGRIRARLRGPGLAPESQPAESIQSQKGVS
jgi:hypothetical protein